VTFDLDANQRVEVTAKERDGTAEASLTVSSHTVRSARRRRARRGERPSRLRPPPDANPAAPARTTDSAVSRPVSGDANAVADHVFVSYSNEDHGYVLNLVEHLRRADVETWWSGDIISGSRWIEDLENRIASSAAVVVVVSHHSYRSQWVINEIIRAQDLNKRIFPLHLSGQRMLQLLSVQHEDVRGGELPSSAFVDSLKQATASAVQ
jgi:hypothetical protein